MLVWRVNMPFKCIIGLPAFNEEQCIHELLSNIQKLQRIYGNQLLALVVNDGSSDHTEEILKQYGASNGYMTYINHPRNLGLGSAVNTLIEYAVKHYGDDDVLVTLDADNTHNPATIPGMVAMLKNENLDIVIASRFIKGAKVMGTPLTRKIYSKGAMYFCKSAFHIKYVRDYSCGFRAYRIGFLKKLCSVYGSRPLGSNGFECMVELLAKAGRLGVAVREYPFTLEYQNKQGKSKMNVKRTVMGYFRLALNAQNPKAPERGKYE